MTLLNETLLTGTTSVSDNVNLKQHLNTPSEAGQTLRGSVEKALHNYFAHLEGADVTDVYNLVLSEVEAPLLETVMNYVKGNQTKARLVSSREVARLMGLPDSYKMPDTYNNAYRVAGDGVAVPVVRYLDEVLFAPILERQSLGAVA